MGGTKNLYYINFYIPQDLLSSDKETRPNRKWRQQINWQKNICSSIEWNLDLQTDNATDWSQTCIWSKSTELQFWMTHACKPTKWEAINHNSLTEWLNQWCLDVEYCLK